MSPKEIATYTAEIREKMHNLVIEFGAGTISNEQFNILYERYNNQLEIASSAGSGNNDPMLSSGVPTIAIRQATSGKAIGLGIYHHRSGVTIETIGTFDLPPEAISPVLNQFSDKIENREFIEPYIQKLSKEHWAVFMARHYTTAIVIFRNEPAPRQIKEMQRLLHDFEEANRSYLDRSTVDASKLARPFNVIVQRKLRN